MNFIAALKVRTRFALVGLIGLIMTAIPMGLYVQKSLADLDTTALEQAGIAPSKILLDLIRLTQQHRGLSAMVLGGNAAAQNERQQKLQEVNATIEKLSGVLSSLDDSKTRAAWDKNKQDWQDISGKLASGSMSGADSFAAHSRLIRALMRTMDLMADAYGLSLDPEYASYELVRAVLYEGPALTESLGRARAKGANILNSKSATTEQRQELGLYRYLVDTNLDDMQNAFSKVMDTDAAAKVQLGEQFAQAQTQVQSALQLLDTQVMTAASFSYSGIEYFNQFTQTIETQFKLLESGVDKLSAVLANRAGQQRHSLLLLSSVVVLLITLGAAIAVVAARSIIREMGAEPREVMAIAEAVSLGDLNTRIVVADGLASSVVGSMGRMQLALRELVQRVRQSADGVANASGEIAQGNQDLSSRTESQASALEETAASMEELSAQVKQNAHNTYAANALAANASEVATRGGAVVGRVVQTMKEINTASNKIADIITVIDGIAFQTNILALNAAVEAARAGDQGRGFAVVASEVRSLAGRSAAAAKEIKSLISASVERVALGTELVDQAGTTMDEVVTAIQRVTTIMAEINAASGEQASGVAQVGEAVNQMDQATQQNAALVEQMAAAASSLKAQSSELVEIVSVFKVDAQAALPNGMPPATALTFGG